MTWLLYFQWPAGVALIMYGILAWADGIEPLLGHRLSAWTERTAPHAPSRFLLGMLSGSAFHGKNGFRYCRRRYLAGLLSPASATIFATGMAIGIFLPASILVGASYYWAFPLLILGMAIQLGCRTPSIRQAGLAVLGLGTCWIGYTACRQAPLTPPLLPYALAGVIIVAMLVRTPATVFLTIAATLQQPSEHIALLASAALILGLCWLAVLGGTLRRARRPFDPPLSLLSKADLAFPERALQAALQENRRMALGLSQAAHALVFPNHGAPSTAPDQTVRDVENAMDAFKPAAQRYLLELTRYRLHKRQARLLMFLFINIGDLERISDHLLAVAENLPEPSHRTAYPEPILQGLDAMLEVTADIINILAQSMTGNRARKSGISGTVEEARDQALQRLDPFTDVLQNLILHNAIKPSRAIRMQELRSHFERLIRHVRAIAVAGEQEDFWIEPDIIHERATRTATATGPKDRLTVAQMDKLLQESTHAST